MTKTPRIRRTRGFLALLLPLLFSTAGAQDDASLLATLSGNLGISNTQAWKGVGALLVLTRERIVREDFRTVAAAIPNAEQYMGGARMQGVVTRPINDTDGLDYILTQMLQMSADTAAQFPTEVRGWLVRNGQGYASDLMGQALE